MINYREILTPFKFIFFIIITFIISRLVLVTFVPIYIPLTILLIFLISIGLVFYSKIKNYNFFKTVSIDFFIWIPILLFLMFYLLNLIPQEESKLYKVKIEDFKIIDSKNKRGKVLDRILVIKSKFGDLKRKVKITMPTDFIRYDDKCLNYPYIEFKSYKGLFGFYVINLKSKKVYNW